MQLNRKGSAVMSAHLAFRSTVTELQDPCICQECTVKLGCTTGDDDGEKTQWLSDVQGCIRTRWVLRSLDGARLVFPAGLQ